MNNLSSYSGLVDAKIRGSDKRFTCINHSIEKNSNFNFSIHITDSKLIMEFSLSNKMGPGHLIGPCS